MTESENLLNQDASATRHVSQWHLYWGGSSWLVLICKYISFFLLTVKHIYIVRSDVSRNYPCEEIEVGLAHRGAEKFSVGSHLNTANKIHYQNWGLFIDGFIHKSLNVAHVGFPLCRTQVLFKFKMEMHSSKHNLFF